MLKIYYDNIIFSLQKSGGISVYWYELIYRHLKINQDIVFFDQLKKTNNIFREKLNIDKESILNKRYNKLFRYFNLKKRVEQKSIFHSSYYRTLTSENVVNIVTVHDFIYENYMKGIKKWIHCYQKRNAILKADGIICISNNTRNDLLKYYPLLNEDKICVIYNGVSDVFKKVNDEIHTISKGIENCINCNYVLFVGDRSHYKNFNIAVEAVSMLKKYELYIVGGGDLSKKELSLLDNNEIRYQHFMGLTSNELNIIYNNAHCLLYPSAYEGFGIPILEAMKAECPVVCASKSSIPEVAGNVQTMVDKITPDHIKNIILRLEDATFRDKCISYGRKQAEKFSWDKCYEETFAFYVKQLNLKFGSNTKIYKGEK